MTDQDTAWQKLKTLKCLNVPAGAAWMQRIYRGLGIAVLQAQMLSGKRGHGHLAQTR